METKKYLNFHISPQYSLTLHSFNALPYDEKIIRDIEKRLKELCYAICKYDLRCYWFNYCSFIVFVVLHSILIIINYSLLYYSLLYSFKMLEIQIGSNLSETKANIFLEKHFFKFISCSYLFEGFDL